MCWLSHNHDATFDPSTKENTFLNVQSHTVIEKEVVTVDVTAWVKNTYRVACVLFNCFENLNKKIQINNKSMEILQILINRNKDECFYFVNTQNSTVNPAQ